MTRAVPSLRRAVPGDEVAVAGVHVRSWQGAYRGLLPDDYLDALRPEDRAARYRFGISDGSGPTTILAVVDDVVVGFASSGPARDHDAAGCGELYAIYVDPVHWGVGAGRVLMDDTVERLSAQGFGAAVLWVLEGNVKAARFYEIAGWSPEAGARRREEVHGVTVDEERYRRIL